MSDKLEQFYYILQTKLADELEDEIFIYNRLTNSKLTKPQNILESLKTIINIECNEINIINVNELDQIQKNSYNFKTYIQTYDDINIVKILLKIVISIYRLKTKLHLILGQIGIDYDVYISKQENENWYSYLDDKVVFNNVNKIYLVILNPVHFHYKSIIYQTIQYTNKYYFNYKDEDLFYIYNYILLNVKNTNLKSYLLQLKLFGQEHIDDITNNLNTYSLVIYKAKSLKNLYDLFLTLVSFDKDIQNYIKVERNHELPKYKIIMNISNELNYLFDNAMEQKYNSIDLYSNVPNYIKYNNFDNKDLTKTYTVDDIINLTYSGITILTNYKRYLQMTNNTDKLLQKNLIKKYLQYNDLLYYSLLEIYNQIYYLLFNFDNKEFVLSYYLENINKINNTKLQFMYTFTKSIEVIVDNSYLPTSSLKQIKSLFQVSEDMQETIVDFIIKKVFNINSYDNDYKTFFNIIHKTIQHNNDDAEIYIKLMSSLPIKKIEYGGSRGEARIRQLSSLFNSSQFKKIKTQDMTYLDYGGGDGEITAAIAKHIKSKPNNTFLYDIEQWFGNIYDLKYRDTITYGTITQYKLPFADNSLDFISCFQVLHHIDKCNLMIKELYRVLKPGGLLVLREHDCRNSNDRMIIDIEHSIFETLMKNIDYYNTLKYLSEYEAYYKSRSEWILLFTETKFRVITEDINKKLIETSSPARYYYDIFTK